MEFEENNVDLFDKALKGMLSDTEQELFDSKMQDTAFKSAYEDFLLINKTITQKGSRALKATLVNIENEINSGDQVSGKSNKSYFLWLGILLGIATIFLIWYLSRPNNSSTEKMYYAYYKAYPNTIDPLTKGSGNAELSAFQLYEQGRYNESSMSLRNMITNDTTNFYIALNHLGLEDYSKATERFLDISNNIDSKFQVDGQWYLALCYLKTSQTHMAIPLLEKLTQGTNPYYVSRSQEILNQVRIN